MAPKIEKLTFPRGGVHPEEDKSATKGLPLETSPPPAEVAVLMQQHIGASARPVVKRRQRVKKGQIVGEAQGYVSANLHAPVSGKVKRIEGRLYSATGNRVPAVIIENDGQEQWARGCNEPQDIGAMDAEQMVAAVQECGVVGMGGATFPAHVKLSPPPDTPVSEVIINGAECEPRLTCDHRLMLERSEEILEALRLIMRIVDAEQGYVGIETNKPEAIELFSRATAGEPDVRICAVETKYPQGAEQQLITAITGREVPSGGGLPADVGCLVHNVGTALAIQDAIRYRRPLLERAVTVTGNAVERPGNFVERIGTSARHILERQGAREEANLLIMGGPMMGIAQAQLDVPLTKGNSGIILETAQEPPPQRACIRCGRCVEHCPLGLVPSQLSIYCENKDWGAAEAIDIMECKECGCCAYICPAGRRIVHLIKYGKAELAKKRD